MLLSEAASTAEPLSSKVQLSSLNSLPETAVTASQMPATHQRFCAVPNRTLGRWELVEDAGEGRFSIVHFGRPRDLQGGPCDYAIKELRPEFRGNVAATVRLRQEAVIGISVTHPNLATVLSAHFDDEPSYIVMPRLRGATLRKVIDEAGTIDVPMALWIVRQTACALSALHAAGWVHADVKPDNIHIAPDGHVTLFDFGLAVSARNQAVSTPPDACTRGTLAYAAPESFTSCHGLCAASDAYSLGVMLYEMLSGSLPFEGPAARLVELHVNGVAPSLRSNRSRIPKDVAQLVAQLMAKNTDRRPNCDEDLQRQLTRLEVELFSLRCSAVRA